MTLVLISLAIALLASIAAGCGGTSKGDSTSHVSPNSTSPARTSSDSASPPADTTADSDDDNDIGAPEDDTNNNEALDYGHAASPAEKHTITALLRRYYTAALAENGAEACSLLYSTLAEAVPEDDGQSPPGPSYTVGKTCARVMTLLFKHEHRQLAAELPLLRVSRVRLRGHRGWAILTFGSLPQREISVAREGHVWKVTQLLDGALP